MSDDTVKCSRSCVCVLELQPSTTPKPFSLQCKDQGSMYSSPFLFPVCALKGQLVSKCHQSSTQSNSESQPDGGSSVTDVSVAAVSGDVVADRQDRLVRLVSAGRRFYAASCINRQHGSAKFCRKKKCDN